MNVAHRYSVTNQLAPRGQPRDERRRRARFPHARLHRNDIVRNAPKFHDIVIEIGDRERRARVAIPRLPNRAGVKQVPGAAFQTQRRKTCPWLRPQMYDLEPLLAVGKASLKVRVAKKSYIAWRRQQAVQSLRGSKYVLILVANRAMDERKSIDFERARGQRASNIEDYPGGAACASIPRRRAPQD